MQKILDTFEDAAMNVVEKVRLADDISEQDISCLCETFQEVCRVYQGDNTIPKRLAYSLIVLRDNVIGARSYYSQDHSERISHLESNINALVEQLLLG